jgi:hypothetical protein
VVKRPHRLTAMTRALRNSSNPLFRIAITSSSVISMLPSFLATSIGFVVTGSGFDQGKDRRQDDLVGRPNYQFSAGQ